MTCCYPVMTILSKLLQPTCSIFKSARLRIHTTKEIALLAVILTALQWGRGMFVRNKIIVKKNIMTTCEMHECLKNVKDLCNMLHRRVKVMVPDLSSQSVALCSTCLPLAGRLLSRPTKLCQTLPPEGVAAAITEKNFAEWATRLMCKARTATNSSMAAPRTLRTSKLYQAQRARHPIMSGKVGCPPLVLSLPGHSWPAGLNG